MRWPLVVLFAELPLSAQDCRRPRRSKVQRPDGPVWNVIRKNFTACHRIDDYAFYAQDCAAWQKLIADKDKSGEPNLSAADKAVLLDFSDPEAKRLMHRPCTKPHGVERVQGVGNAKESWRATLVDMRERGPQLSDEEIEKLVEWLARAMGN